MGLSLLFQRRLLSYPRPRPFLIVGRAIFSLDKVRLAHSDIMSKVTRTAHPFDKTRLEALLNRRFFYAPAFEIYGGEFPVSSCHHQDYPIHHPIARRSRSLRLRSARILPPSQHHLRMAAAFYHRGSHARARYNYHDSCTRVRDIWTRRAICRLDGQGHQDRRRPPC